MSLRLFTARLDRQRIIDKMCKAVIQDQLGDLSLYGELYLPVCVTIVL